MGNRSRQEALRPQYGKRFLEHHAGRIIAEPEIAVVELVANSWDAGADRVDVTWPRDGAGEIAIADNGTGMTLQEFEHRWMTLNYDRDMAQGSDVEFPPGVRHRPRKAHGHNGIGRHAAFCFADSYIVTSIKAGAKTTATVTRSTDGHTPYRVATKSQVLADKNTSAHGTTLLVNTDNAFLSIVDVLRLLGSRFVADPEFALYVNGVAVETDVSTAASVETLMTEVGELIVRRHDANAATSRTSRQNGIVWWVNKRAVGVPSWSTLLGPLIDSRRAAARRYTYIVEADLLRPQVKPDWTGFYASHEANAAYRAVEEYVRSDLRALLSDERRERKRIALEENKFALEQLPALSQDQIAGFLEEIQVNCPTLSEAELDASVKVLAKLEQARSGFALIHKLAQLDPSDLDGMNEILDEWSVTDAKKVLGELKYRLELIQKLEGHVEDKKADELHDLQPLFERGLWIFGPEFESLEFSSNRTLATIIQNQLGGGESSTPRKRPDFVMLPDRSVGVYSRDEYGENHEVAGIASVVVLELKRGGSRITDEEKDQALRYTREIRRSGRVSQSTKIRAYVLGTEVDSSVTEITEGATVVLPRTYSTVLHQAHARTFNLYKKVRLEKGALAADEDIKAIVVPQQGNLYSY